MTPDNTKPEPEVTEPHESAQMDASESESVVVMHNGVAVFVLEA
jgi:hypothetical protein